VVPELFPLAADLGAARSLDQRSILEEDVDVACHSTPRSVGATIEVSTGGAFRRGRGAAHMDRR
jgi:hypothetical protein